MPKRNRYKALCEAYDKGVEDCNSYRRECREFVQDLKSCIIAYLGCPETKVFLFQPSKGFIFKTHVLRGDEYDTEFGENGVALIGFAINVNQDELEDKFFNFLILFKKMADKIHFHILEDSKEFQNTTESMEKFCQHLFDVAKKGLEERLEIFLESPEESSAPIGFKVKQEA